MCAIFDQAFNLHGRQARRLMHQVSTARINPWNFENLKDLPNEDHIEDTASCSWPLRCSGRSNNTHACQRAPRQCRWNMMQPLFYFLEDVLSRRLDVRRVVEVASNCLKLPLTLSKVLCLDANRVDVQCIDCPSKFLKTHFSALDLWIRSGQAKWAHTLQFFMLILCRIIGPLVALEARRKPNSLQFSS